MGKRLLLSMSVALHASVALAQLPNTPDPIEIDLDSGFLSESLPFDQPYILTGQVAGVVTRVEAKHVKLEPGRSLAGQAGALTCPLPTDIGAGWIPSEPWRAPSVREDPNAEQEFFILFPALDVNEFYCFSFERVRAMSEESQTEFRQQAIAILDRELRRTTPSPTTLGSVVVFGVELEVEEGAAIRRDLIRALFRGFRTNPAVGLTANPRERLDVPSGTLFHEATPTSTVLPQLAGLLQDAATAQSVRFNAAYAFNGFAEVASAAVGSVAASPLLNAQNRAALVAAQTNPDFLTTIVRFLEQIDEFAGSPDAVAAGLPTGSVADTSLIEFDEGDNSVAVDPASLWETAPPGQDCTVAAVRSRVGRLTQTIRVLRGFQGAIALDGSQIGTMDVAPEERESAQRLRSNIQMATDRMEGAVDRLEVFERDGVCERRRALEAVADGLVLEVRDTVRMIGSTSGSFQVRAMWHFSADVGLAVAPQIGEVFPHVGVNIYFRPVNREAPLSQVSSPGRRLSLLLGMAWTDNIRKAGQREGLFAAERFVPGVSASGDTSNAMLVVGAGVRLTDALALTAGALVFKGADPNPLLNELRLETTPFFSLSWDWNVVGQLGSLFGGTPAPAFLGLPSASPQPES